LYTIIPLPIFAKISLIHTHL